MSINKRNYDSEFCGSLPLHNINLIQAYGYLLVLERDLSIIQASNNIADLLGIAARDLMSVNFNSFINPEVAKRLEERLSSGVTEKIPLHITVNSKTGNSLSCVAILHQKSEFLRLNLQTTRTFLLMFIRRSNFLWPLLNRPKR
jgi:light-regulated signal transduction histidine kinase (bacteriophytochrome)